MAKIATPPIVLLHALLGLVISGFDAAAATPGLTTSTGTQEDALRATVVALQSHYASTGKLVDLSPREAAMQAMERNLTIQRGAHTNEIAHQALLEARAVFDPVLSFSVTHDRSKRSERIETDQRFRSATTVDNQGRNVLDIEEFLDPRAPLVVFTTPRDEGFAETDIIASQEPLTGTSKSNTIDVSLEQQLPWGADLLLAYEAVDQDTFFINNSSAFVGIPNPPLNLVGVGSYDRPWVSSLLANISVPLPGSKEFGQYAEQEVSVARADLRQQRAGFQLENDINATLLLVDSAYWRLTRAHLNLHATRHSLALAEEQLKATDRLYRAQSATEFDRQQAELQVALVAGFLDSAWSQYVQASNNMIALLDMPENSLLIPTDFQTTLSHAYAMPAMPGERELVDPNPSQRSAEVDIALAQLDLDRSETRTKPDLGFSANINLIQSNRLYGYDSFGDSLGQVFNPDITSQRYAIEYAYPWGNRFVRAQRDLAQAVKTRSEHLSRSTQNQLVRQLRDARATLASSERRVELSLSNRELAQAAYDRAVAQKAAGLTRELEITEQNTLLLQAELDYIASLTSRKEAEAQLLAVLGTLSQDYAKRLSHTEFEDYRLNLLVATNSLRYFGSTARAEP